MEKTYTHKITTMDGKEKTITMKHLTARDAVRMADNPDSLGMESLIETVSPGVLDIVSLDSMIDMVDKIEEKDKAFFVQMVKLAERAAHQADQKTQVKKSKKVK